MISVSVWTVLLAAGLTAIATGLGALPFLFIKEINRRWLSLSQAAASAAATRPAVPAPTTTRL
jgi:ZIP family zinc transporter